MTFFDRKEEVIDIELTQFGKHLLSKGRFKPSYYAFFDDDVIYDSKFAAVTTEAQNEIEPRIKEVPRLKTQYVYRGVETEMAKNLQDIRVLALKEDSLDRNLPDLKFAQSSPDKHYSSVSPIGSAKYGSDKAPAWKVSFLKGELSSSAQFYTGTGKPTMNIPQLEADVTYKTYLGMATDTALDQEPAADEVVFPNGTAITLKPESIILEIEEANGLLLNSDFEIEVFLIEEEKSDGTATGKEILIPLRFQDNDTRNYFVDDSGVLKQKTREEFNRLPDILDPTNVEWFVEVEADLEIDPEELCKVKPADKTKGLFAQRFIKCRKRKKGLGVDEEDCDSLEEGHWCQEKP